MNRARCGGLCALTLAALASALRFFASPPLVIGAGLAGAADWLDAQADRVRASLER